MVGAGAGPVACISAAPKPGPHRARPTKIEPTLSSPEGHFPSVVTLKCHCGLLLSFCKVLFFWLSDAVMVVSRQQVLDQAACICDNGTLCCGTSTSLPRALAPEWRTSDRELRTRS